MRIPKCILFFAERSPFSFFGQNYCSLLTYFRVNDPYRIIVAFVVLILIRLPYLLYGSPISMPQLSWMLVGERLSAGYMMYSGVWDETGPLAALIYQIIEFVFDRNPIVYVVLAIILTTYQALLFNNFLLAKKAYDENTFVPALVYILLSSFSFDFYFLSPVLIALTWILLAMRNVFYRIESRSKDNRILGTGIYLGLAVLCYLPSLLFLASTIIAYLLFTNVSFRRYMLLLYGTALPLLVALTYYFLNDSLDAFMSLYVRSFFELGRQVYMSPLALLYLGAVPLIFLLVSFYRVGQIRFTNQQSKIQQIMFITILATVGTLFLVHELSPYHMLPLVPPAAFYITHYLLSIRRYLLAELATFSLMILLTLNGYAFLFNWFSLHGIFPAEDILVQTTDYNEIVKGKKILVLGSQLAIYQNATPATPYLDWHLSSTQFSEIDYFGNLTEVYNNFVSDMPQVIIDQENVMPELIQRIPLLERSYRRASQENVYLLQKEQ